MRPSDPRPEPGAARVLSRRSILRLFGAAVAAALAPFAAGAAEPTARLLLRSNGHPDPRPGIDGSRVLTARQLTAAPDLAGLFDNIREIPHIADGIRCYCGCAQLDGYRSLLSCYEDVGMAQFCEVCQGQGRLAHRRWKEGQSLDQIRRATDARYGHGAPPTAESSAASAHCHG
jgi:hypothetical protein